MRQPVFPLMIFSLLLAATGWAAAGQGDGAGVVDSGDDRTNEQYTALIQSVPSPPRWFKGTDGRVHLVYELLLTNAFPVPVTVTSVEVLDADQGGAVAVLGGAALTASMSLLTGGPPLRELPPSTVAVVWFDLTFADRASLPAVVTHQVTAAVPPGLGMTESVTVSGRAEVDLRPPVVLGPPLLGPRWVAAGSCCDGPHRRALFPLNGRLALSQRFAIDFNRLDAEGRLTVGDPRHNASAAGYNQPVIAVADAVVVAAVDRFPDQTPGDMQTVEFEGISGNQVILDLGEERFAFYAHLRPGSVAVHKGDRVVRGQRLGELGNSGNSSGPHLHFHVMDRPSPQVADGLPYVFDSFVLTGSTPPIAELMVLDEAQHPVPIDTAGAGPRQNALPLGEDEVTFPVSVAPTAGGDFAGLVEIGNGRRMYLECQGQGSPTVVLVSGYPNLGRVWSDPSPGVSTPGVLPAVARFTRVCAYDRPGTIGEVNPDLNPDGTPFFFSRSDPVLQPHSAEDTVADLHALLRAAAVPGPYVLAAHSLGGMYARLYAAAYPDEVAGMVQIDACQEQLQAEFARVLPPTMLADMERMTLELRDLYPALELVDGERIDTLVRKARVNTPLRPMPLAVLSRGHADDAPLPGFPVQEWEQAWRLMQDDLATLVPNARHTIARRSGHYIHQDQPQLVTDTIRQVVTAVRDPASWPRAATDGDSKRITWRACPTAELPSRECGELVVPLSYREPQGATILLVGARVPATDPARRIGSLFLNPGGPGVPEISFLPAQYAALPAAVRERFDLVGFDPRGVGESAPIRCFDSPAEQAAFLARLPRVPVGPAEAAALLRAHEDLARRCGKRNAAILSHLSTFNVAQDLDRLRQVVGDERLNYLGTSYGTYLGATYANLFPDRIRAMVLDGVINPPSYTSFDHSDGSVVGHDTTSFLRILSNQGSADALAALFEECVRAGGARCAFAASSAAETRAKFDALMDRLRTQPSALVGPAGPPTLTYSAVLDIVWMALYVPPSWPQLVQLLEQLHEGDTAGPLAALEAARAMLPVEYRQTDTEAQPAINCVDTDYATDPGRYPELARTAEERTPYFGALWTYLGMCPFWPAEDVDRYQGPWDAQTSATILLISRRYDPATPHGGAVAASRTLANARLLTIDGWGHGFFLAGKSNCADEAMAAYFINGQLPTVGTVCPEDAQPFGD